MSIMHDEVVTALRAKSQHVAGLELVTFVWENHSADPEDVALTRVEDFFLPTDESPAGSAEDRLIGEYHLNVLIQRGAGDIEARRVASHLKNVYRPGYGIVAGPHTVVVEKSEIRQGRVYDENRYAFPVVVTFRVDAPRLQGV